MLKDLNVEMARDPALADFITDWGNTILTHKQRNPILSTLYN